MNQKRWELRLCSRSGWLRQSSRLRPTRSPDCHDLQSAEICPALQPRESVRRNCFPSFYSNHKNVLTYLLSEAHIEGGKCFQTKPSLSPFTKYLSSRHRHAQLLMDMIFRKVVFSSNKTSLSLFCMKFCRKTTLTFSQGKPRLLKST